MEFVIEPLDPSDINECVTIVATMAKETLPAETSHDSIKRIISNGNVLTLVAKKDRQIVALVNGSIRPSLNIAFMIVTDAESARRGIGSVLIDNFVEIGSKRSPNSHYVTTSLPTDNTSAVALYSAKGFAVVGFLKEALWGKDLIILRKRL
jgi:GNAT superfamily N-acetyltransferase